MTDLEWLDAQQREHNLASYRWPEEKPRRVRHTFTPEQLRIAREWAERQEKVA